MKHHRVRTVRRLTRAALVTTAATAAVAFGLMAPAADAAPHANPALREVSGNRFIGTAVNDGLLNNGTYSNILRTEFNSVTAENAMKWDATEPSRGNFNFSGGDRLVSFAQQNGMKVYGHTLVWHSQAPGWAQNLSGNDLRNAMTNHVTQVVNHYKGQVERWDVVNEVLDDNGGFRSSFLYNQLGESFIADAFRAAHAADPSAKLYINDYSTDWINSKSDGMYRLVQRLLQQGVPIHGVGFQSHHILGQIPSNYAQNLQRFADLGVKVAITELDVRIQMPADNSELEQQRRDFNAVARACVAVSGCEGVTVWGISDKDSWVPDVFGGQGAACPWDDNYQPKPAYYGLRDGLQGR